MSPTLWRYSLRHTARRPLRSLLALLGITIGVATVVAVSLTTHTMREVYGRTFSTLIGRASLEVVSNDANSFAEEISRGIEELPEIDAAVNVIQMGAAIMTSYGPSPVLMLAIDPVRDESVRVYEFAEGEMFSDEAPGLLIGQSFAESYGIALGEDVRLISSAGQISWPVRGILKTTGAARFNGGAIVFASLRVVQKRFDMDSVVNGIHLVRAEDTTPVQAREVVQLKLPNGLHVQAPNDRGELARDAVVNLEQILSSLGVVSLVAGAFVILNTFRINLEERRQQLAVLRALGATATQVTRLLLRDGIVFGCVGTLLGILLGFGIAQALRPSVGLMFGTGAPELAVTAEPFLLALLLGPSVTLIATYLPARQAGRRFVLPDLLARREVSESKQHSWPRYLGLVMLLTAAIIVITFTFGWLPTDPARGLLPFGMVCVVAGTVLSLPWILLPITALVNRAMSRVFHIEGKLAMRELERHASRTSLTVGVLVVAIVITVGPGNEIISATDNLNRWFEKAVGRDFVVQGAAPDVALSLTPVTVPYSLAQKLSELPSVSQVHAISVFPTRVRDKRAMVIAAEHDEDDAATLDYSDDSPSDVHLRLCRGDGVVIGTTLAQRVRLDIGDELDFFTKDEISVLPIIGKVADYNVGGMTVHISRDKARDIFRLNGAQWFGITVRDGRIGDAARELKAFCGERGLLLQSFAELRLDFKKRLDNALGFLWTMMGLVFLVASMAIVNTVTMNVLDQMRELGVLRAIGMQRTQVRKMIVSQAMAICLISLVPGVGAGLSLALAMNLPAEYLTGHRVPFVIHFKIVGLAVLAAISVTLLGAWLPAQYANRIPIVRAIQYE